MICQPGDRACEDQNLRSYKQIDFRRPYKYDRKQTPEPRKEGTTKSVIPTTLVDEPSVITQDKTREKTDEQDSSGGRGHLARSITSRAQKEFRANTTEVDAET